MNPAFGYRRKTLDPLVGTIPSGTAKTLTLGDICAYVVRRKAASAGNLSWKPDSNPNPDTYATDGHELTSTQPSSDRVECADRVITISAVGGDVVYDVRREGYDRGD